MEERQSNIEILRIIAMIMIVFQHYAYHGGFEFATSVFTLNRYYIQCVQFGGKIGVFLFVMISGYFMINSAPTLRQRINKLALLWGETAFYSIIIAILFFDWGNADHKQIANILAKSFMPITFRTWWFVSTYFILFILSPYINKFIKSMSFAQYKQLLIIMGVIWFVIPTFTNQTLDYSDLLGFIYAYSIGAYFSLYKTQVNIKYSKIKLCTLLLLTFLLVISLDIIGLKISAVGSHATYFMGTQSIMTLLISVYMFWTCLCIKPYYNRKINRISSTMFAVYLIHDNDLTREFFWVTLFKNYKWQDDPCLVVHSLLVVSFVILIGILIDLIRQRTIERAWIRIIKNSMKYLKISD